MSRNLKTMHRNHLPILHRNQQVLDIVPRNIINVKYKRKIQEKFYHHHYFLGLPNKAIAL